MPNPVAGFFGKLPCAGDFVQRRLPSSFVDVWDGHFETAVAESRNELGTGWRDAYHASPVWRFLLGAGVCGDSAWLGIMGPGVDRVGRCFPMVIAAPLASDPAATSRALTEAVGWLKAAENVHAEAQADARITVEAFDGQVADLGDPLARRFSAASTALPEVDWRAATHWRLPLPAVPSAEAFLAELWGRLASTSGTWCLWWTAGSERVPACALATNGLPAPAAYAAFLDAGSGVKPWRSSVPLEQAGSPQRSLSEHASNLLDDLVAAVPTAPVWPAPSPSPAPAWLPDDPGLLSDLLGAPAVVAPPLTTVPAAVTTTVAVGVTMGVMPKAAVESRPECGLTVLAAEVGLPSARQRAVDAVSAIVRALPCDDLDGGMQSLCSQLLMLNPPLRQASEDLIDPVLEDCAVIAAHVEGGKASLLRIGSASAWHYRQGRVQPLFAQGSAPARLPGGAVSDEFDDLLFSSAAPVAPGLGAAEQPTCGEVQCEAAAGDRLLLLANSSLLQLPAGVLASSLALSSIDEARQRLAQAAGLGTDAARWPLTIIEMGA
ncbi:type VI secretion system-associated protein TagF [Rhodanobacter sp. AS-Z3]|uniref:type VI secretion system-associated protein TagF n=1 Tax=Rhodanobacter sp. AS-Z3 TaxID=3031330 RepID=UPI00247A8DFE|nr:type VI secretion system-associated protein TagF [Rhodanobacter sp. AS-Z3]WEN14478.1 type VI secretion system-associated protein TagF [Rhodanobacter sp. AS-Z3]